MPTKTSITLKQIRAKLKKGGFTGLYIPDECGCSIDDLAPCGECQRDDGEEFINGCKGGYAFQNPQPKFSHDAMVKGVNQAPTTEEWEEFHREFC